MQVNKIEEKIVVNKFFLLYKEKIDPSISFEILELDSAQSIYPLYNGENPDFVVHLNGNYIGIELFELIGDKLDVANRDNSEQGKKIISIAHLAALRRKGKNKSLFLVEDLVLVALERINDKIRNKLIHYVDCPIWLVGYAIRQYNLGMLSSVIEDGLESTVASYISKNVPNFGNVTSIWLSEFSGSELLLKVK